MKDQLVSPETTVLARLKGFREYLPTLEYFDDSDGIRVCSVEKFSLMKDVLCWVTTQSLLQKWIRETRGVHITIQKNAGGYFWEMCKSDYGTDLGWADMDGPNDCGGWDTFEGALENALKTQLSLDLPQDLHGPIKHWGNYASFAKKITK